VPEIVESTEPKKPKSASIAKELLRPDGRRWDAEALVLEASSRDRVRVMEHGTAPALESLVGWEFAGTNSGPLAGLLGIRKFKKGFYEGPARAASGPEPFVQGYNVQVRQNRVGEPHIAKPNEETPKRFGFYRVHRVVEGSRDARYPNALLLDYGLGGNPFWEPAQLLRDYLVQVYPDDPDFLLGHAYGALGPLRIRLNFFALVRMNQHSFVPAPSR
jgi:hypothetical protein